jgi:hypothetical protein
MLAALSPSSEASSTPGVSFDTVGTAPLHVITMSERHTWHTIVTSWWTNLEILESDDDGGSGFSGERTPRASALEWREESGELEEEEGEEERSDMDAEKSPAAVGESSVDEGDVESATSSAAVALSSRSMQRTTDSKDRSSLASSSECAGERRSPELAEAPTTPAETHSRK